jgi:hypothetical protein
MLMRHRNGLLACAWHVRCLRDILGGPVRIPVVILLCERCCDLTFGLSGSLIDDIGGRLAVGHVQLLLERPQQ